VEQRETFHLFDRVFKAKAQISDDKNIVIRIFQYILNKAPRAISPEGGRGRWAVKTREI
jgi:hypothetical protein